jgi:hypothetical protein
MLLEQLLLMVQTEMYQILKNINLMWTYLKGICCGKGTQTV